MHSVSFRSLAIGVFAVLSGLSTAASSEKPTPMPCTVHSPNTGSFFDLRSLALAVPDPDKTPKKDARVKSWQAKGWDYNANFSMNICAPVIEPVRKVNGIDEKLWQNVSAYYQKDGKTFSIGDVSSNITFRGRKLVLQYINGSPCGQSSSKNLEARKDGDDISMVIKSSKEKDDKEEKGYRRKSTIISFHCEKEPLAQAVSASFVGTDPDECAYFFEVRSQAACGGAESVQQGLSPGGVFGIIVLIAVVVYFIGGIMYQRSVAHARGWRQLPNYSLWASIGSFFQVSLQGLIAGAKHVKGPRVASVRDGVLPTMEHRPTARGMHRSYGSRSTAAYYPP